MFYRPEDGHGLPHNPFNAIVAPRPIGWISSLDETGSANLAPYSFFNAVAYEPPQVMYASTAAPAGKMKDGRAVKDTVCNIEKTGEFVVNLVTWDLREAMNKTSVSAEAGQDEFLLAGLEKVPSKVVAVPGVAASPVRLECRMTQIVPLKSADPDTPNLAVFGQVVGIHIDDGVLTDGLLDMAKIGLISRLGYRDYGRVTDIFQMTRPDE
ncbi:flavin reductase family protein [Aestuariispira insulae]|uniref:Flavin reductase (DIM6/NTAB) family NADH-FMN oxidoreductase RutF n=1 Tax=Aestuariispira insulae TaxID=1461337 RepID=A0A3D9HX19_9PROT|nr:flavin reductase family protein [Aestuariispira insulae]RED53950.1 flavin reductase (DIM6/NTAB) family NADH-FMN oxidoreductase RutF [Aestuariispira insulae]